MKKKSKKILITLLSAACITAGAFGITACKKDASDTPATLQSTYYAYVRNVGSEALSYESWLELIIKDIVPNLASKTIANAEIRGGELILTYKDGYVQSVGSVSGNLDVKVLDKTVTLNSASASAIKSVAKAAADSDELKSEYDKYVAAVGTGALSYENWLSLISDDFVLNSDKSKTVKNAVVNKQAKFVLTYADDSSLVAGTVSGNMTVNVNGTEQIIEIPVFTVTAVDQNNNPVKNIWLKLSYFDKENLTTKVVAEKSKTDAEGKAYFVCVPQENTKYQTSLADGLDVPSGYKLDLGYENQLAITSADFDADRRATVKFKYVPDDFMLAKKTAVNYKRAYNSSTGKAEETNSPTQIVIEANRYSYLTFMPYAFSSVNDNKAVTAASGRYKISVSANSSADVVMYNYSGTVSFMSCDPDTGIPNAINYATGNAPQDASDASVYTGNNSIELNVHSNVARTEYVFGIKSNKDCTVTITVERLGDAAEPPTPETVKVKVTGNPAQCANQSGTLTEVDVEDSANIVLGNDGYYHIGSRSGPILYVNLNKALPRVADVAIKDLPKQMINGEPVGEAVFVFTAEYDKNGFATLIKDYNDVIKKYSSLCNSDGVYGVNQDLYDFLHLYGNKCYGIGDLSDKSLAWLLPCQYYA